jgi:hypothetical protein
MMQPIRLWCPLRTLDRDASGRLDKRQSLAHLQRLGWSQASAYRLISKGMGTFWREETTYPHGTRGQRGMSPRKTLVLVGAKSLAATWELEELSRHQVEVPRELCAGDVSAWNAIACHAWIPGPRAPRIAKSGFVQRALPNHPYSRAKIREDTGISERAQIPHQEMLLPGTGRKVTPKQANYTTYQEELRSKRHSSWGQKRLGNSYTSNLSRRGWGQGKAFNREQSGSRPHALDATGSSSTGRARRFFEKAKDFLQTRQKDRPLYPDAKLRISSGTRDALAVVGHRPYLGGGRRLTCSGRWPHEGFSFLSHVRQQVSIAALNRHRSWGRTRSFAPGPRRSR